MIHELIIYGGALAAQVAPPAEFPLKVSVGREVSVSPASCQDKTAFGKFVSAVAADDETRCVALSASNRSRASVTLHVPAGKVIESVRLADVTQADGTLTDRVVPGTSETYSGRMTRDFYGRDSFSVELPKGFHQFTVAYRDPHVAGADAKTVVVGVFSPEDARATGIDLATLTRSAPVAPVAREGTEVSGAHGVSLPIAPSSVADPCDVYAVRLCAREVGHTGDFAYVGNLVLGRNGQAKNRYASGAIADSLAQGRYLDYKFCPVEGFTLEKVLLYRQEDVAPLLSARGRRLGIGRNSVRPAEVLAGDFVFHLNPQRQTRSLGAVVHVRGTNACQSQVDEMYLDVLR